MWIGGVHLPTPVLRKRVVAVEPRVGDITGVITYEIRQRLKMLWVHDVIIIEERDPLGSNAVQRALTRYRCALPQYVKRARDASAGLKCLLLYAVHRLSKQTSRPRSRRNRRNRYRDLHTLILPSLHDVLCCDIIDPSGTGHAEDG